MHSRASKPIVVIDKETGEVVAEYPSMSKCAEEEGLYMQSLAKWVIGKGCNKTAYIYKLKAPN